MTVQDLLLNALQLIYKACLSLETLNQLDHGYSDFKKKVQTCYIANLNHLMTATKARDKKTQQEIQGTDYLPFVKKLADYQRVINGDIHYINPEFPPKIRTS